MNKSGWAHLMLLCVAIFVTSACADIVGEFTWGTGAGTTHTSGHDGGRSTSSTHAGGGGQGGNTDTFSSSSSSTSTGTGGAPPTCATPGGVTCTAPSDCTGVPDCKVATCDANCCGTTNTADGTQSSNQTAGDCQVVVCDGHGGTRSEAADTDKPADGACQVGTCTSGVPGQSPKGQGTACASGGGRFCDGTGACVECLYDFDCTSGGKTVCSTGHTCIAPLADGSACVLDNECTGGHCYATGGVGDKTCHLDLCSDGLKSGGETDVDCGSVCGATQLCSFGQGCAVGDDCATGLCDGSGKCIACMPGAVRCAADMPQLCDSTGQWQNQGPACAAPGACSNGVCCSVGYANCDGIAGNGCEVHTAADLANCGSCGYSCGVGTCSAGACILRSGGSNMAAVVVDAQNVYWADGGIQSPVANGVLWRMPVSGGSAQQLYTSSPNILGVALAGGNVYWTHPGSLSAGADAVYYMPSGGGSTGSYTGQSTPNAIATDDTYVYWVNYSVSSGGAGGQVIRAPLGGGSTTALASNQRHLTAIAADGKNVYWTNGYLVQQPDGTVSQVPRGGGAPVTLATGQSYPNAIASDGSYVYWTNGNDGTLKRIPVGGATVSTLSTDAGGTPYAGGIAVDGTEVFFASADGTRVLKVPTAGGAPTVLATTTNVQALAVDATSVYWLTASSLMKARR